MFKMADHPRSMESRVGRKNQRELTSPGLWPFEITPQCQCRRFVHIQQRNIHYDVILFVAQRG